MNPIMSMLHTKNNAVSDLPKVDKNMTFGQFVKLMKNKDPKAIVDQLCASGQMSTTQRDTLVQQAQNNLSQFTSFLK